MALIAVSVVSAIFWASVIAITGVNEPWDSASYWTVIYPAGLALSAILGRMLKSSQWSAGAIVMLGQIPAIAFTSDISALLIAGIFFATILSIPAMAVSWLFGRARQGPARK